MAVDDDDARDCTVDLFVVGMTEVQHVLGVKRIALARCGNACRVELPAVLGELVDDILRADELITVRDGRSGCGCQSNDGDAVHGFILSCGVRAMRGVRRQTSRHCGAGNNQRRGPAGNRYP